MANYESKFTLLWQNNYCSLDWSDNILWLYFLCTSLLFFFLKFVNASFLLFKFTLNSFVCYMKSINHMALSVILQLSKHICCPLPVPVALLSSFFGCVFVCLFVCFVLVLLYNCHPRTDLHCSSVFNSLSPLPFVLSFVPLFSWNISDSF